MAEDSNIRLTSTPPLRAEGWACAARTAVSRSGAESMKNAETTSSDSLSGPVRTASSLIDTVLSLGPKANPRSLEK